MAKIMEPRTSFNGGELSPLLAGRVDVAKFNNSCERMRNFIPTTQGPALSRPGFRFVKEVKNSAHRTRLMRFEFSTDQSYMLEFGDQYIRFYADHGVLLSGGTPYEIASPYAVADLTNDDGTFALRYVQTGDVIYIVHPEYAPRKLSRVAATNWTLEVVDLTPPPFKTLNITTTTVYASASTGTGITLTASAAAFTSDMVGQYIYLQEKDVRDNEQWEAVKAITAGDIRRSDGKNYEALNSATTGAVKPTHTVGAAFDGDGAVQWQYLDSGYGWAKITAFGTTTSVTADVIQRLPGGAVGSGNATTRWALQAWNDTDGWPSSVTFFRERLTFARDFTVWFSVAGDFENFAYELDGDVTADAGFDRVIASDRTNSIRWLSAGNVLLVGTLGDEWAIAEQTTTDAFGPLNAQTRRQSTYGSSMVAPVRIGGDVLFVQKAGKKVRSMAYQFTEEGFLSPDVTVFAEHVTKPGIVDMCFQQEPWQVLWAARSDGVLIGLTYNREQDVIAWHQHPMAGAVECVEEIPAPDGARNDLWVIARFTINGATKRYIGYLEQDADETTAQEDWFYVDFGLTYSGASTTTITGLGHLEGEEVWILANGAVQPSKTVTSGAITLDEAATKAQVGLPLNGVLETTQLDPMRLGLMKRVNRLVVRLWRSLLGKGGATEASAVVLRYRTTSDPLGSAPSAFTGDVEMEWPSDYGRKQTAVILKDGPTPVNLVALFPPQEG